jgi:uncharacterized membrane protein YGL010W
MVWLWTIQQQSRLKRVKTENQWLAEYAVTHQNPVNRRIHHVCVPLIFWSVLALLSCLPTPRGLSKAFDWSQLFYSVVLVFYLSLGLKAFLKGITVVGLSLALNFLLIRFELPLAIIAGTVFALAWCGQFYGHKVEGRKPAFFEDLLFLLIGPLWIFS